MFCTCEHEHFTCIFCDVPNLISTFVMMLLVVILNFIEWLRHILYMWAWAELHCNYSKWYSFHSFLAPTSTRITCEVPNLISTFVLMLIVLSFIDWRCGICEHEYFTCIYGKRYTFHSFLALNSTRIICEVPNLISTVVVMLIVMIIDWWFGWGMFCTCVHENLTCIYRERYTFQTF